MKAVFLRALEETTDKSVVLREAVMSPEAALGRTRFEVETEAFGQVPRSPFAYWVSDRVRALFSELPAFESQGRTAKQGLATADDFRFVRLWTEVGPEETRRRWYAFTKGGRFSPYYADVHLVVDWNHEGEMLCSFAGSVIRNPEYYYRPGLSWPLRGIRFSAQAVPAGCVFSVAGKMAFGDATELPWLHGLFNSKAFDTLISFFAGKIGGVQYEVGLIQNIPIPKIDGVSKNAIEEIARSSWLVYCSLDSRTEISHAFLLPALLQMEGASLDTCTTNWFAHVSQSEADLTTIRGKMDDLCFDLYGIDGTDRQRIEKGLAGATPDSDDEDADTEDADTEDAETTDRDAAPLVASLLSWTVGIAFGRFDLRLATGERPTPPQPEPFDPLPVCSPGMLTGKDGLPVDAPPQGYPIDFPRDGILVDDPGAPRDLVTACRRVFDPIFDDPADRWDEAADILGDRATGLRSWLAQQLFEQHVKRYSKSRRKAPIYWQLATPSASYSVWLYYHRFTRDTMFRVLNDHVTPKLQHEERKLNSLRQEAGLSPSSAQRRDIDNQDSLVGELRAMRDEVARLAPLWNPNLNDGVILNFAPLWRLVPQHKTWQKECKSAWDKLCNGEYDWAHLAMHLWPERVVPKCAKDRSLAIAHGLEDVFWQEGADGKWQAKSASADAVHRLVNGRTSAAVKDALRSLLLAPTLAGGRGGGGRRKKASRRSVSLTPTKPAREAGVHINRKSAAPAVDQAVLSGIRSAIAELGGNATKSDIIAAAGLDDRVWAPAINALLADGSVVKTGQKRGTRYHLAGGAS